MPITDVASKRYASALLDVARERGVGDRCLAELESFVRQVKAAPDLAEVIRNPGIPSDVTRKVVTDVATGMRLDPLTVSFLGVLAHARRLDRIETIVSALREEIDLRANRAQGQVTSAGMMSPSQVARIRDAIGAAIGRTLILDQKRDPALLGGVRVTVGDRVFDLSARTWLDSLRSHLLENR